eukprot:8795781-Prorocentrum_lima.AAC.1
MRAAEAAPATPVVAEAMAVDAEPPDEAMLPLVHKQKAPARSEKPANLRQPTDWHIQPGGTKKCTCRICSASILKHE